TLNIKVMKKVQLFLLMLTVLPFTTVFAQDQEQRIQTSYILAFNKQATGGEVNYWKTQGNLSVAQLLERHKQYIAGNRDLWDGVLRVSYTDAFGRAIKDGEYNFHIKYPRTYVEMMSAHMVYLNQNPSLYDEVIRESYRAVFGRNPADGELNYWKGQQKVAWIWLFRAHKEYAASNRRNTASMSGVKFIPVSASVMSETRRAVSNLVGNDGASLIGNDGGSMVAAGAGNLIGMDGSTMVAAGAGN
ncbi:MAG: hypothetical protein WKF88_11935, partial [Ferruginibacter sp.]